MPFIEKVKGLFRRKPPPPPVLTKVKDFWGDASQIAGILSSAGIEKWSGRIDDPRIDKILRFSATEGPCENVVFLLMCARFTKDPTYENLSDIVNEFVIPDVVNLQEKNRTALVTYFKTLEKGVWSMFIDANCIDAAELEIRKLVERDSFGRLKEKDLATAFILNEMGRKTYSNAIRYLNSKSLLIGQHPGVLERGDVGRNWLEINPAGEW